MVEAVFALAIFGLLATATLATALLAADTLLVLGCMLTVFGLLSSVVGGALYHALLYSCLHARRALPQGWYWQPTRLHAGLHPHERARIMPWFFLGASGFGATLLGCATVVLAVLQKSPP